MELTPLEGLFVDEFCRFAKIANAATSKLRASGRSRSSVGFITTLDKATVPYELKWGARVFDTPRVALVGPAQEPCGSLLFFDLETGMLEAIEGFVFGDIWPAIEEPSHWSTVDRSDGRARRH
ncbi:MAG TPA: hypothetical protein VMF90_13495 [Rhizobiaceae bacterium]|nr:hypothetical protein [Rhizobiaceae bacterium]